MNLLKHWFLKYIMPAFGPATVKDPNGVLRPTPYKSNGRRVTAISWGALNVKLRQPYQ